MLAPFEKPTAITRDGVESIVRGGRRSTKSPSSAGAALQILDVEHALRRAGGRIAAFPCFEHLAARAEQRCARARIARRAAAGRARCRRCRGAASSVGAPASAPRSKTWTKPRIARSSALPACSADGIVSGGSARSISRARRLEPGRQHQRFAEVRGILVDREARDLRSRARRARRPAP